ncbi:MAG: hypothetical protein WC389_16360 [Lutibacter sp.]
MKNNIEKRYELTEFYCEKCKGWHTKLDAKFHEHIQLTFAYSSFRVEVLKNED